MQTNSSETPPTVNELYLHLHTVNHDGMTFIDTRSERLHAPEETSGADPGYTDQPVDDEAVYLNVAGECPKGRVYGLGSLGRKKRRYADPGASTSQMPEMVPRAEFDIVADQLRKVFLILLTRSARVTMDGAGLSQPPPPPPPPPPHDQQQPPQIDPADPPQQGDNVELETQEWLTRDEQLDVTFACLRYARFAVEMFVKAAGTALSLALKCLSFDFVGTSLDESSEEFGTVQVSSAWRPVLEDMNLRPFYNAPREFNCYVVDGRLSQTCYLMALDTCYSVSCAKSWMEGSHKPRYLMALDTCYKASRAKDLEKVAELIGFQRCIHSCLEYLEAVPWVGDEEEEKVLLWLL
ncbi:hypothetical protein Scep_002660 [Stephania cephalantha]|uniref:Hydroxymethylglutaryl-coenzyme A synthase C-terminal domain-containing protein n=1 Tax=Stephania cephalantha TaxID=152367 RepID=A0AAP0Q642_9MAGN